MAQLRQELTELGLENAETTSIWHIFLTQVSRKTQLVEIFTGFLWQALSIYPTFFLVKSRRSLKRANLSGMVAPRNGSERDVLYTEGLDREIRRSESCSRFEAREEVLHWEIKSSGANSQKKKPIAKQPITSSCLRCLSIVIPRFEMQKPDKVNF